MWPNLQETVDLVTFTEEILNWKLRFLCSDIYLPMCQKAMGDVWPKQDTSITLVSCIRFHILQRYKHYTNFSKTCHARYSKILRILSYLFLLTSVDRTLSKNGWLTFTEQSFSIFIIKMFCLWIWFTTKLISRRSYNCYINLLIIYVYSVTSSYFQKQPPEMFSRKKVFLEIFFSEKIQKKSSGGVLQKRCS